MRIEKDSLATRQMGVFFMEFLNELADGPVGTIESSQTEAPNELAAVEEVSSHRDMSHNQEAI